MKPLSLLLLLLAVGFAVLIGTLFWGTPSATEDRLGLPEPQALTATDEDSSPPAAPLAPGDAATESGRRADAAEDETRTEDAEGWLIEGRVRFAGGALADERRRILAAQPRADFERAVEVGPAGAFAVRVPSGVRSVTLDLDAPYHYLEAPLEVSRPETDGAPPAPILEAALGGRLRVTLTPPQGHGVTSLSGAKVSLSATRSRRALTREAVPLGAGVFELRGVAEDALWKLRVRCAPFVTELSLGERVFAGETRELALALQSGVRIAGSVRGPDGAPQADALVSIERFGRSDTRADRWTQGAKTQTDESGSFSISNVRAGELRVRVEAQGAVGLELELGSLADGEERLDLALELNRGGTVAGRVFGLDGGGVAGADVRVLREREPWVGEGRARTDAAGAFRLLGLGDGPFLVTARAEREGSAGLLSARIEGVLPGAAGLELELGAGDRIAGVVLDDRGAPLPRFTIVAVPIESSSAAPGRQRVRERLRAKDGRFEFGGLAEGPWDVRAEARDHADAGWTRVELPDGGGELEFTLARLAAVRGVVRGPAGAPVEGAVVRGRFPGGGEEQTKTDAEGAFELEGLVPGETELVATRAGVLANAPLKLALVPGEARAGVELTLRVGARLVGQVDAGVEDFAGRQILVRPSDAYTGPTTLPDEEGGFSFEGLAPGRWSVLFDWQPSGGGGEDWIEGYQRRAETEVVLVEGQTTHVVLGVPPDDAVTVRGAITDGGEPCPRYILYVYPENEEDDSTTGLPLQISRADDEGRFALQVPGPGSYRFTIGESVNSQVRFFVEVGEGPSVARDFELPGNVVAGRVVLEDGSPSPRHALMLVHTDAAQGSRAMGNQSMTTTDLEGHFRIEGVMPGEYRLRTGGWGMASGGLGVRVIPDIVVEAGEDLVDLVVEVQAAAVIEGRVIDSDGRPAQDVRVEPYDEAGRALYRWQVVRTDHAGGFRLDDLGAGRVRIVAELPDGRFVEAEVEARPGAVTLALLRP